MSEMPNLEKNLHGPELYSWWLHIDRNDEGGPVHYTLVYVQGWNRYSEQGSVEVHYYSLNSTTNNRTYQRLDIPEEIEGLTVDGFWELVESGNLQLLEQKPFVIQQSRSILDIE